MEIKMKFLTAILAFFATTAAFADAAAPAAAPQQGFLSMLPIFVILILFMYLVVIRPQTKRAKEQKNLLGNLKKGDEVLTSGGIIGTIEKLTNDFIVLKVANNVNLTIQKAAIVSSLPKGTTKTVEESN
jgi:preprotein translocase subunit YajC